ncbi:MAG TPA: TIGR02453 family protein [Blastocatellia bacterium]|nr:TIGR02453 family protein [Blastocatellia bacterium]
MPKELRFTPGLFDFLRELKANNKKDWFDANKDRYVADVRDPLLAFIAALRPRLLEISPHLVADPKPTGGSMFRIYRDTRFSKNKEPYKTTASAFFSHQTGGKDGPGIYLHLDPESCFVGIGHWRPDPVARTRVTDAIAAKPYAWRDAISSKEFRKLLKMEGDSLAKLPKQYDPRHPFAEDLKRKDFIVISYFSEKQACAKDFIERFDNISRVAAPYLGFIIKASGLRW